MKKYLAFIFLMPVLFTGCSTDKYDASALMNTGNNPGNVAGDTIYVKLNPSWEGFNNPHAILVGHENFIYVCDTDNDRIVMLNTAGTVLGTRSVKHPTAITQDYKLNLIVCAELDTTVSGVTRTYSAVYKINMYAASHVFENTALKLVLPKNLETPDRKYTAVTAFYDNSYFVARTGPNNTSIYDPDNIIIPMSSADELTNLRVPNIDPLSTGLISANGINSMTSFDKKNFDFVSTFSGESAFKTQWFNFYSTMVSEGYKSKYLPESGVAFAQPNRFLSPMGSCIDQFGNIYVADADKDSVFKFDAFGEETHSFGGPAVFNKPAGVAYFDRTLYVLDAGDNKIYRFILSTDLR